jgi:succinyl-diaminopimelate desuccinylase
MDFNFRFCTESTPDGLQQRFTAVLDRYGFDYSLQWIVGGLPFLTPAGGSWPMWNRLFAKKPGLRRSFLRRAAPATAAFSAQVCGEVLELGPPNASIHKIDEHVDVRELETLKNLYRLLLGRLAQ